MTSGEPNVDHHQMMWAVLERCESHPQGCYIALRLEEELEGEEQTSGALVVVEYAYNGNVMGIEFVDGIDSVFRGIMEVDREER